MFKAFSGILASLDFTLFPGLVTTHMDTNGIVVFPLHFLQFVMGDDIESLEDRNGAVSGNAHDGE